MGRKTYFNKIPKRNVGASLKAGEADTRLVRVRTGQDITGNATRYSSDRRFIGSVRLRPSIVVVRSRNRTRDARRVSQRVQMSRYDIIVVESKAVNSVLPCDATVTLVTLSRRNVTTLTL